MDLPKLLAEYSEIEKGTISDKQILYINNLSHEVPADSIIGILTKVGISSLSSEQLLTLDTAKIFMLIEELKKKAPVNIQQALLIMQQFDDSDLNKIIKKNMQELTVKDAEILLSGPEKFNPWIKEHPLISQDEWEYGWQESNNFEDGKMYYLKFYNMMMIDIDSHDNFDVLLNTLKRIDMRFRIYQTQGGYHVFIISSLIKYNHPDLFAISKQLGGDIYYALFAHKTGFKVRLNSKKDRQEPYIARFVCEIGIKPTDPVCKALIKIHDQYIKLHR